MVKLVKMGKALKTTKLNKDQEYEFFQYGPLVLERKGRYVSLKNIGSEDDLKKIRDKIKENRPNMKKGIGEDISKLIETIKQYDPVQLIHNLAFENTIIDPETYKESTSKVHEGRIELALSLVSAIKDIGNKEPDGETIKNFGLTIEKIRKNVIDYFLTEDNDKIGEEEREIREWSIMRLLGIRGNSFSEHHIDLVRELFSPCDNFLNKKYGFSSEDVINCYLDIEKQINNSFQKIVDNVKKIKETQKVFSIFAKKNIKKFSSAEDLFAAFRETKESKQLTNEIGNNPFQNLFEVNPQNEKQKIIYPLLSFNYGDNYDPFLTYEKAPGWPTNDSIVYTKPILSCDNKYYCFGPSIFFRNLIGIVESLILKKDKNFFKNKYQDEARKEYLENKTLSYFKALFPDSKIYKNLFYRPNPEDSTQIAETDGIVIFDNNIFIIEVKSGKLSTSARRGSLERIRSDAEDLLDNAYNQAIRTKNYIKNNANPIFEDGKGNKILEIKDNTIFKNIYLITSTLDPLDHLSTRLNSLKAIGLINGAEWPWSVFIDDLRVISEIVEFPSEFISFLQHRIRANDFPQFLSIDELDFFMFYLKEGLYFENGNLKNIDRFSPNGYTEDLDRYYDFIAGRVSSGDKPKIEISDDFINLIKKIEASKKLGFSQLTTNLLGIDNQSQEEILKAIKYLQNKTKVDNKTTDATFIFGEFGITFVSIKGDLSKEVIIDKICLKNKYNTKLPLWFLVILNKDSIDFEIFEDEWKEDSHQEENLEAYRQMKWTKLKQSGKKIERNDPCFCNSGKKYKKCCYLKGFIL